MSCACQNPKLNDPADVEALKKFYDEHKTLSFTENLQANIASVGIGAGIGAIALFAGLKLAKKIK